jgi:hypothetical protein
MRIFLSPITHIAMDRATEKNIVTFGDLLNAVDEVKKMITDKQYKTLVEGIKHLKDAADERTRMYRGTLLYPVIKLHRQDGDARIGMALKIKMFTFDFKLYKYAGTDDFEQDFVNIQHPRRISLQQLRTSGYFETTQLRMLEQLVSSRAKVLDPPISATLKDELGIEMWEEDEQAKLYDEMLVLYGRSCTVHECMFSATPL